ncbi:MAG: glycosyltransferase family 4 protein [candidate division KSB1 bacterium]|nr:glycosyltransferase family 4 protein [candidate division KSB1 bacterium]
MPPSREVEKLYNGFDVFCLSSVSEGCSNVILEALACGVPVVATRTGGNPELVQHDETGLLFEVHDADGLAQQLLRLYQNNDLLHALQEAGPRTIAARFSLERTVDKYQRLYESLLQRRQHKIRQKTEAASARSEHGR